MIYEYSICPATHWTGIMLAPGVSQLVSQCLRLGYFGLAEVRQFEIGAALWGGQWDAAARLLLTANRQEALRPAAKEKSFALL